MLEIVIQIQNTMGNAIVLSLTVWGAHTTDLQMLTIA